MPDFIVQIWHLLSGKLLKEICIDILAPIVKLKENESGATLIEYALIIAFVSASIVGTATIVGSKVGDQLIEAALGLE